MFDYKKIIVVGCPGSGKSTFSRKLSTATNIDLFHLDAMYWNKDCTHTSRKELIRMQKDILKNNSFIIDGNFKSTLELRLKNADVVYFFDLPVETCIDGTKNRKGNRPEMPCELPCNDELIDFIKNFNADIKPNMLKMFDKYNSNVITFHSHDDADKYINIIKKSQKVDLTLKTPKGFFNHRVAAVIKNNNKLLAQKNTVTNEYYLVGGRVAFGESTEEALVRELKEELKITVSDYKPLWVNECFFNDGEDCFHEIGVYYLVDIKNTDFNYYQNVFETKEDNRINTYEWLDIDELDSITLYPQFIKDEIKNQSDDLKLIITNEL